MKETLAQNLRPFVPEGCSELLAETIINNGVAFKVVRPRKQRLGTYSIQRRQVTVNSNLNAFHFLYVSLHEIAHHRAYVNYGIGIKPHGREWKQEFSLLLKQFLYTGRLPKEMAEFFMQQSVSPCATANRELLAFFARFD